MNVNQKTVVVTGGARGIGKALALRFAEEGARVVVADRLQNEANETAAQVNGLAVVCDVENEQDIQQLQKENLTLSEDQFLRIFYDMNLEELNNQSQENFEKP